MTKNEIGKIFEFLDLINVKWDYNFSRDIYKLHNIQCLMKFHRPLHHTNYVIHLWELESSSPKVIETKDDFIRMLTDE